MLKKYIIILLLIGLLWPTGWLLAAYNDFQTDADVTVNMSGIGTNLTIRNGANVESMLVGTNTITLALRPGSSVTIESSDRKALTVNGFSVSSVTCPSSGSSAVIISSPTVTETGTITVSSSGCNPTTYSSGGGGGGGVVTPVVSVPVVTTPTNTSISIEAGVAEVKSTAVTLTLSATDTSQMMISNQSSFSGASWETYATSKAWTLSSGLGKKTVYAKFKSSSGGESSAISDTIMLLPTSAVKAITASAGGKIGLSDDLVAVDVPAGAVSKDTSFSISPTTSYTAPTKEKLVGDQVYELKAEVSGTTTKNFSKDLTLTFKYTADQIKGLKESTLAIYYWDATFNKWVKVGGTIDATNKTISAKTNHFTLFAVLGEELVPSGALIKIKCDNKNKDICTAVYYVGNDGKRYVFTNDKAYLTWYSDFSNIKEVTATEMASYKIGGNVTYRPGVKMIKITSDPKTYAISKGGALREIATEAVAKALYGATWNKQIDDVSDAFFVNYKTGAKVTAAADYVITTEKAASTTINMDKGL